MCDAPEIVIVMDASGSITDDDPRNWQLMREFIENLVRELFNKVQDVRIALVTFSKEAHTLIRLSS